MTRKRLAALVLIGIVAGGGIFLLSSNRVQAPAPGEQGASKPAPSAAQTNREKPFDKTVYSLEDPSSPWVVVNKKRPLPNFFQPDDLMVPQVRLRLDESVTRMEVRALLSSDLTRMFEVATKDDVALVLGSGYRPQWQQSRLYYGYVDQNGQAAADTFSARPGYSEHQTGLAFDVTANDGSCSFEVCFADTAEGRWVAEHAHEYGFIIRYPHGKEPITGYQYEPWHLRYVGVELAAELFKTKQTMEEFFGLPAAPSY